MATFGSALRRGLPRAAGGDAWPPPGAAPVTELVESVGADAETRQVAPRVVAELVETAAPARVDDPSAGSGTGGTGSGAGAAGTGSGAAGSGIAGAALRRGLPRVTGGEPWPPAGAAPGGEPWPPAGAAPGGVRVAQDAASEPPGRQDATPGVDTSAATPAPVAQSVATAPASRQDATPGADAGVLRRGLPRESGGEPWPPAGVVIAVAPAAPATLDAEPTRVVGTDASERQFASDDEASAPAPATPAAASSVVAVPDGPRAPLPFTPSVWPGRAASHRPAPKPEPQRFGPFTKLQWAGAVVVGGLGLLFAAALAVLFVRFFLSMDFMQDFLATYPGEYHLPEAAPVGIPAWLGWQHFFNVFLMVLIIRTGLTIRTEKRPAVFWTPRNNPKGKTSLTIWFHQSLDLLWIVNGVVYVVLLFATGQWMRIIPTSWEVFPNALSAALQYVSLDWPTENGWVNYNALQQIAYFATVFLAAPLAIVTGFRMSGLWPKNNAKLTAAYPIEWARKLHFPTMLYFVVFIVIHVALVLATGALRNLNHMYAAQGSVDGVAYADNWTGFWMFVLSLAVIAAAWVAARPLVLAPIARLFGTVSGR